MPTESDADVIVVGAGVIGCIAARALAPDHDVLVLDRDSVAAGASGLAGASAFSSRFAADLPVVAGHINQWFHDYDAADRVDLTRRWDYEPIFPAETADERDRVAVMAEQGYPVDFVDADDLADRCPWMDLTEFDGAIRHDDYAWLDPVEYTTALADDARADGAEIRTGVEVTEVTVEDGRVVGVDTDEGSLTAETVVAAAGWRTPDLLPESVSVPIRPYITQGCEIEIDLDVDVGTMPAFRIPVRTGEGTIYGEGHETLLLRPKANGNLRVAGGHEAPDPAEFDYVDASDGTDAWEGFLDFARRRVPELFPGVDEVEIVEDWAGTGGGLTPDTRPVIDAPSSLAGLVVATGFRAGFMQSPIAAHGVRSLVAGDRCPFGLDPFALGRF